MKRTFDIVMSSLALAFLAVPLLVAMLILRFTGEGEIFFLQERVGWHGHRFQVFKFATMRKDSESTGTRDITLRDDPRVLPVGRFLRKMKINELPQLLNVLRGEMSLVGWRPLMPVSFSYYPSHVQRRIVKSRPGLTGIGSIVFRDEEAITERLDRPPDEVYRDLIFPYKGALEVWYQEHQSFSLDLKIIAVTMLAVLGSGGDAHLSWFPGLPPRPEGLR
jgi:lipopolysaccharide/colanic/teichoic acid biosynthesis glycosyltransferase